MIPVYHVDFRGKWISGQEYKEAVDSEHMYDGSMNKYARWLKDFVPISGNDCFFGFKYDKDYYVRYVDGKTHLYGNFLEGLPPMRTAAVGAMPSFLIYAYTPEELRKYKEEKTIGDDEQLQHIYQLAEDENANPILLIVPIQ